MLLFIKTFFSLAARYLHVEKLRELANAFPRSIHLANKFLWNLRENFTKFVVCPKCHKLYRYSECWLHTGQEKETKLCNFVKFPRHTFQRMRSACGEPLLQVARTSNGTTHLVAFKTLLQERHRQPRRSTESTQHARLLWTVEEDRIPRQCT